MMTILIQILANSVYSNGLNTKNSRDDIIWYGGSQLNDFFEIMWELRTST